MKKSGRDKNIVDINVSPIKAKSSNETTPVKPKRKTSRKDQGVDVHTTTCSTPSQLPSNSLNYSMYSPSCSFPYSQENCPDVVWDYTSPKLPKGSKRRDIKITVDEFLKKLSQHQVPESTNQTSHCIKLLEQWMTKQNTQNIPVRAKNSPNNIRRNKKRSRKVIEEIKEFMESIKVKNEGKAEETKKIECITEENMAKADNSNLLNTSLNKMSFLQGDTSENDSMEELWGEVDNSFIIKATQELDVSYSSPNNILKKNLDILSTIPETIDSNINDSKNINFCINKNENFFKPDEQAQILLTQIINCEWDSGSDDDWDKGFIAEDNVLSCIPDEVLCGTDSNSNENFNPNEPIGKSFSGASHNKCFSENKETVENTSMKVLFDTAKFESSNNSKNKNPVKSSSSENRSGEISFNSHKTETPKTKETEDFNNFDDENFDDESILCKPEVLSWIDEVESQMTQSQRCTPEEIEKKKDDAIKRRKSNRNKIKT